MLKIKDNVDLKELEKFGFKKIINKETRKDYDDEGNLILEEYEEIWYSKKTTMKAYNTEISCGIIVTEDNKQILKQGRNNIHFGKELVYKYVEETLFDLIEAGLVERV